MLEVKNKDGKATLTNNGLIPYIFAGIPNSKFEFVVYSYAVCFH